MEKDIAVGEQFCQIILKKKNHRPSFVIKEKMNKTNPASRHALILCMLFWPSRFKIFFLLDLGDLTFLTFIKTKSLSFMLF